MLAIYIVSAIVGGGLVLIGALFGHGDHGDVDHGGDLNHDVHFDHDSSGGDAHIWIPFLSLRFWTYFFAAFGISGLLLFQMTTMPDPVRTVVCAVTGLLVGTAVSWILRATRRIESDSNARTVDFLGLTGKVVVAIRPGSIGKIRVHLKGDTIELLAEPNDVENLAIGEEAVIVTMENDRARVMSKAALLEETHLNA